jgi:predicted ATP-grasp superfamily ATP-dependent carboligase
VLRKMIPAICVLALDAQECHALSAIRSLGGRGVRISAASPKPRPMGFFSRYVKQRLTSPSPAHEPELYAEWLLETLDRQRFDAMLFFGQASAHVVARHRDAILQRTGCLVPPQDVFLSADRKDRVARLAASLGVPVPATHELARPEDAAALAREITFPAIVKGVYGSGGHQVAFVRNADELVHAVHHITEAQTDRTLPPPVIQEYIPGHGYGLTALMHRGTAVATFMHRRLSEHAIARGELLAHAATAVESVEDPELRRHGTTLLQALGWEGMAMVEFRRSDRDGKFYLMEINPRFPGSTDLAVAAGVDFPWLYVQRAVGEQIQGPDSYRLGMRYRWLLSKSLAPAFENPLSYMRGVLDCLRPGTPSDLSLRDPRPHLVQLYDAAWWVREYFRGTRHAAAATENATAAHESSGHAESSAAVPETAIPSAPAEKAATSNA